MPLQIVLRRDLYFPFIETNPKNIPNDVIGMQWVVLIGNYLQGGGDHIDNNSLQAGVARARYFDNSYILETSDQILTPIQGPREFKLLRIERTDDTSTRRLINRVLEGNAKDIAEKLHKLTELPVYEIPGKSNLPHYLQ